MNLKEIWKEAEKIIATHYQHEGYQILETNFTMRWGELDIIAQNDDEIVFIEVKAVDHTDDLHNYVTPLKLSTLEKTIQYYLYKHPTTKLIRLDIAFVRANTILDIYRNITNN